MILSVSRRTDIPALYSDWFFTRLKEGYVLVRNPMNAHQISKVPLTPELVDCFVFWTKDPTPMLSELHRLADYHFYFQVTITGYDEKIEPGLASKTAIIASFQELARQLGKERVIWRYDPIILTESLHKDFHLRQFEKLAEALAGSTEKCVISFVDIYRKIVRKMNSLGPVFIEKEHVLDVAEGLSGLARLYGLTLETCSEALDFTQLGIMPGKCIDDSLISRITGQDSPIPKDQNQRPLCGCVASIDIGAYDTCTNGCLYCYANGARTHHQRHDPRSPLLVGEIGPRDRITERKMTR